MTSLHNIENLVKSRDELLVTIQNLELGLHDEKKKLNEFEFYLYDKNYDKKAMEEQIIRSKENIKQIKQILETEKNKLSQFENAINEASKIVVNHKVHVCLTGAIPHNWMILSRHNSGKFSQRVCNICGTVEKVGIV